MRYIATFALELSQTFQIVTIFDSQILTQKIQKDSPQIQSITSEHPSAAWFERKMHDDFGIIITHTNDTRPLIHHEHYPPNIHPLTQNFQETTLTPKDIQPYSYETTTGEGAFNVSVGPVHAGIIEPGHFHFSQAGEEILHLEVRHFYKNRGIEKMLESMTLDEAKPIIERISGTESIAYQICLRDITLQASNNTLPLALQKRHALLLELERVIHHLNDLGFIPNDAGFASAHAFCSKLCEDARAKMQELTSHRFGFGAIHFQNHFIDTASLHEWLDQLQYDIVFFEEWISDIPSLWDRLDATGRLSQKSALRYDTIGVVARSSGVQIDRRSSDFYYQHGFKLSTQTSGDVAARFKLRIDEIKNSITMMHNFIEEDESSFIPALLQDGTYHAYCESALGELFMCITLKNGLIQRFFVRDPSFINWQALHIMMRNNIIADFPLINKSCDLSYAGSDL